MRDLTCILRWSVLVLGSASCFDGANTETVACEPGSNGCPFDLVCDEVIGRCVEFGTALSPPATADPDPDPDPSPAPEPECTVASGCQVNEECVNERCSRRACSEDLDCPDGSFCQPAGCALGSRETCDQYTCSLLPGRPLCLPEPWRCESVECAVDFNCVGLAHCDSVGRCTDSVEREGFVGEQCDNDEQCNGDLMCESLPEEGNLCTRVCSDAIPCPAASQCFDSDNNGTGLCLPIGVGNWGEPCEAQVDCIEFCAQVVTDPDRFECSFRCGENSVCPPGYVCGATDGDEDLELCFPND